MNFTVITDSNPLTYVLTSAKLDATSHRWLVALSTYSFKLQHHAGHYNLDADALSRLSQGGVSEEVQPCKKTELVHHLTKQLNEPGNWEIQADIVDAICQSCLVKTHLHPDSPCSNITLVESLTVNTKAIPDAYGEENVHGLPIIPPMSHDDLRAEQQADPTIREIVHQLETGEKVSPTVREELPELPLLLGCWSWTVVCCIGGDNTRIMSPFS